MLRQADLVKRVKRYDPTLDEAALARAYSFTAEAHGAQTRASGDPYFSHPIEVAAILTQLRLDGDSIITGLLHDTVEDTMTTLDEIGRLFGPRVMRLVDGVTKLSRLEHQSENLAQAENFRKLLIATSEDIRVLLVKLADRLHNMRTLEFIKSDEKRARIARETMEIYVPLAERIGVQLIKDELEDLAFKELRPEARESIVSRLEFLRAAGGAEIPRIVRKLRMTLKKAGIAAEITGREKRPYSIWTKMQRKSTSFEQVSDIMAFRVLVDTTENCYRALGAIHTSYAFVPDRFRDYISTPKRNGYRSLHTTVIGPSQPRIEAQIRTREMHEEAELGVAAHWIYKQGANPAEGRQYRALREIWDILDHEQAPDEWLHNTKLQMFQDQVFCFTPKGELIALPRGATPIDFAYAVHSEVGDSCVSVRINGKAMPLKSVLNNGDQVEVITSDEGYPSPTWEQFVVTGKARSAIRRFIRTRQHGEFARLGEALLRRAFRKRGVELEDSTISGVLDRFGADSIDHLYAAIGRGDTQANDVLLAVLPEAKDQTGEVVRLKPRRRKSGAPIADAIPIRSMIDGVAIHHAACCNPLPGDRIVGISTTGRGVTVHTLDCETLVSYHSSPERWVDVAWDLGPEVSTTHIGRLNLVVANERGSLGSLASVIAKNLGNINNLKITNRTVEYFEMALNIEVESKKHLDEIVAALRIIPEVNSVERARA